MKPDQIHVLIVEDDSTQGNALLEAFKRAGYQVTWCNSSAKALTIAQRTEFHCLIVDCMLPKMNGVDLVEEILQLAVNPIKVFLFSGIFKDKGFIKEAIEKTNAIAFYQKPLDLSQLLKQVEETMNAAAQNTALPLVALYSNKTLSDQDLRRLVYCEPTIHSVHLPMLYKRLQQSQLSGELTLMSNIGDVSSISFYKGNIFEVRTPDKETYFGGLAVELGFVSLETVMEALKDPSQKLLGQKLIDSMSLSPHAINLILEEQLALRLSQTLKAGVVSLQWTDQPLPNPEFTLNKKRFEALLNDWTYSKIEPWWIKTNFALWGSYNLTGHTHPRIKNAATIDDLLANPEFVDGEDLPYLFRQFLLGDAVIGARGADSRNFSFLEKRLSQLLNDYKSQNHFQILGIGERAHSMEVNKAFADLKQHFDPKVLPQDCPPSVIVKCTQVFKFIEEAYKILSDENARARYILTLQNKRAQELLENEPVFRAAIIELQNDQPKQAAKRFQLLLDKKIEFKDLRAYRIWAGLKTDKHFSDMTLDQVPPEERHSAPYFMAKGVHFHYRGQIMKALECFRTAHVLDPRLGVARNELEHLKEELERKGQNRSLIKEVTTVMDTLLGKSATRRGA